MKKELLLFKLFHFRWKSKKTTAKLDITSSDCPTNHNTFSNGCESHMETYVLGKPDLAPKNAVLQFAEIKASR